MKYRYRYGVHLKKKLKFLYNFLQACKFPYLLDTFVKSCRYIVLLKISPDYCVPFTVE